MATGEPNEQGIPNRPLPDDSLWQDEPPIGSGNSNARSSGQSPGGQPDFGAPRKNFTSREHIPAVPTGAGMAAGRGGGQPSWMRTAASAAVANPSEPIEDENNLDILLGLVQSAPAWLISAVVHTTLLIILAVGLAVADRRGLIEVSPNINLSEPMGDSFDLLEGPVSDQRGTQLIEKNDSQVLTPQNLPQVDNPFATPPELSDIRLGGLQPVTNLHAPTIGLALNGREAGMKGALLGIYGGTGGTESAVGRGLEWLAKQQRPDGMWSLAGPYSDPAVLDNPAAATAMALLAFQGAGVTPAKGKYAKQVDKAWTALLKTQQRDGSFGLNGPQRQGLYTHAQCTIALCEILGMTREGRFYEPAQRAVAFCVASQDKKGGGWRYDYPPTDSDTSVTGWFVMALKSAQMAGLEVPQETLYNITRYLDSAAMGDGRYAYTPGSFGTLAVTAEAYLCRQLLGWKQDDVRLVDGCKILTANLVKYNVGEPSDVYYWYYATQVCHHMEGTIWTTWNETMRKEVPEHQVTDGPEYGSWDPKGDKWGSAAGRLYTTCLSIFMLEVYYRHLPIYSAYKYTAR